MVGLGGLEPPTSPLSGVRSNHLSYRPKLSARRHRRLLAYVDAGALWGRLGMAKSYSKGGDPAAPSDTATLLRLHPSHEPLRGKRPPCG